MEGLGQDVRVHVPDGAQGGWDGGAVGIQGMCINVLAINKVQEVCKLGCNKAGV